MGARFVRWVARIDSVSLSLPKHRHHALGTCFRKSDSGTLRCGNGRGLVSAEVRRLVGLKRRCAAFSKLSLGGTNHCLRDQRLIFIMVKHFWKWDLLTMDLSALHAVCLVPDGKSEPGRRGMLRIRGCMGRDHGKYSTSRTAPTIVDSWFSLEVRTR